MLFRETTFAGMGSECRIGTDNLRIFYQVGEFVGLR